MSKPHKDYRMRGIHTIVEHYRNTIGKNHHRTGNVYVKVAEHYHSSEQYDQALYVELRLNLQ